MRALQYYTITAIALIAVLVPESNKYPTHARHAYILFYADTKPNTGLAYSGLPLGLMGTTPPETPQQHIKRLFGPSWA